MDQKLQHNISQKNFFQCLKMHHFRAVSPKWVLRPQKEISCHIFKMAILTKFFDNLMNHITREYAGKTMKLFLNVSPLTIVSLLLWPFKVSSLYCKFDRLKNCLPDYSHLPNKQAVRNKRAGLYFSQNLINWQGSKSSHSEEIKHCNLQL